MIKDQNQIYFLLQPLITNTIIIIIIFNKTFLKALSTFIQLLYMKYTSSFCILLKHINEPKGNKLIRMQNDNA